jgi:hypothetical protein
MLGLFFFGTVGAFAQSESEKIENLIEQKRDFNKNNKNSSVYKIQLYNGNETEAYKIKRNFELEFPEYETVIDASKQPDWKTQVGYFKTRLEADRILTIISEKFEGAIVLKDKI